jgi:membrane protein involved in colicin uptake
MAREPKLPPPQSKEEAQRRLEAAREAKAVADRADYKGFRERLDARQKAEKTEAQKRAFEAARQNNRRISEAAWKKQVDAKMASDADQAKTWAERQADKARADKEQAKENKRMSKSDSKLVKREQNAAKKEALKRAMGKLFVGKGGRGGGLSGGGGVMPWELR